MVIKVADFLRYLSLHASKWYLKVRVISLISSMLNHEPFLNR